MTAPKPRFASRDADREPEPVSIDEDRAYRAGYRWAQSRDVTEPRACITIDGGPGTDGCLAYAEAAQRNRYARGNRYDARSERGDGRYARDDGRYAQDDDDRPPWWR